MRRFIFSVSLVFCCSLLAQQPAPQLPEASKVRILKAQRDQARLQSEYANLKGRMAEIEKQFPETQKEMQSAIDEAYRTAKVEKKDYALDVEKLEFVAVAKPPVVPPQEPKAGEKKP